MSTVPPALDAQPLRERVHVWCFGLEDGAHSEAQQRSCSATLDDEERQHVARLRRPTDQHLYIVAHGLLRQLLGVLLNEAPAALRFTRAQGGKPHLVRAATQASTPALHFNMSHSHRAIAIAVSACGEVGVDIERIQPTLDIDGLAPLVLHAEERSHLAALDATQRSAAFFRTWTCKEAWLKARGTGLAEALTGLVLMPSATQNTADLQTSHTAWLRDAAGSTWPLATRVATLAGECYSIAVAIAGATPALRDCPVVWHDSLPAVVPASVIA